MTAPTRPDVVLEVEELRTTLLTGRGPLAAVDGVSLRLARGETLGVVGESGSGKSVLGRTIMGLHRTGPRTTVTGRVELAGHDVHRLGPRALRELWGSTVGMVFQDPMTALNPVKKVGRHLDETIRRHQGLGRAAARARTIELLALVGIHEPRRRAGQYPHELSGGMRQRVVIAMALANDPALLIADEPTTALDVTVQRQILDLLERLQAELGMAVLLVSHNLGVVAARADRVAVMYAGRIVETAAADQLFAQPRHPYTAALLAAIPRLDLAPHLRLGAIEGSPPDMAAPPPGCRFAPRCAVAEPDCRERVPVLRPVDPDDPGSQVDGGAHVAACFHPVAPARAEAVATGGER